MLKKRVKPMTKITWRWMIALVVILVQLGLSRTATAKVVDRIVAKVNNEIITLSELNMLAKSIEARSGIKPTKEKGKQIQRQMLEMLIDRKLAKAEAKRRGIQVSPKELNETLAQFKQRNHIPDDQALAKALSKEGLTLKEFKGEIADQLIQNQLIQMIVRSKVMVSDAEVRRFYDERFKNSRGGSQVHLLTLRLPYPPGATEAQKEETKQKVEEILSDIKRGATFGEAAAKYSLTPTDVGYVAQSDLDPRLADYLANLKPKQVAPVAMPGGFQLVQVLGHRRGETRSFEEVAPRIRQMLTQEAMQKQFSEWVKTLRAKAHIKIML
jgi:peptidyl-prolyl cis-trans isomerase SurA